MQWHLKISRSELSQGYSSECGEEIWKMYFYIAVQIS